MQRILKYEAEQLLTSMGFVPIGPYRGSLEPWECLCSGCGSKRVIRLSILKHAGRRPCRGCAARTYSEAPQRWWDISEKDRWGKVWDEPDEQDLLDIDNSLLGKYDSRTEVLKRFDSIRFPQSTRNWAEERLEKLAGPFAAEFIRDLKSILEIFGLLGLEPRPQNIEKFMMKMEFHGKSLDFSEFDQDVVAIFQELWPDRSWSDFPGLRTSADFPSDDSSNY